MGESQPKFWEESRGQKFGDFTAGNLWENDNQTFRGIPGNKNWGISQQENCGKITTKLLGGNIKNKKLGDFTAGKLWENYNRTFSGDSKEQKLGDSTAGNLWESYNQTFRGSQGQEIGGFHNRKFVGKLQPNF